MTGDSDSSCGYPSAWGQPAHENLFRCDGFAVGIALPGLTTPVHGQRHQRNDAIEAPGRLAVRVLQAKPRLMKPARRDDLLEQGGGRVNRSANSITPILRATGLHLRQQHPLPGESRIGLATVDPQSSDRGRSARRTLISSAAQ